MTPCRYCGTPGAYDSGLTVECVNPRCEHYCPPPAVPFTHAPCSACGNTDWPEGGPHACTRCGHVCEHGAGLLIEPGARRSPEGTPPPPNAVWFDPGLRVDLAIAASKVDTSVGSLKAQFDALVKVAREYASSECLCERCQPSATVFSTPTATIDPALYAWYPSRWT